MHKHPCTYTRFRYCNSDDICNKNIGYVYRFPSICDYEEEIIIRNNCLDRDDQQLARTIQYNMYELKVRDLSTVVE